MAGYSSLTRGLMDGYGFVDNVYRNRERDQQIQEGHDELMKQRRQQTQIGDWQIGDEALRRDAEAEAARRMRPAGSDEAIAGAGVDELNPYVAPAPGGLPKVGQPAPVAPPTQAPAMQRAPTPMEAPDTAVLQPQQAAAPAPAPGGAAQVAMRPERKQSDAQRLAQMSQHRQQFYMERNRPDLAVKELMASGQQLAPLRQKEWTDAWRRYTANRDVMEFARAYAADPDDMDVTSAKPVGRGADGEDIFEVTFSVGGKEAAPQRMTRSQIEQQSRAAADPVGYQKMLDDRKKAILESQLRREETMIKERFQKAGNYLVDTQSGKVFDGNQQPLPEFGVEVRTLKGEDGVERPYTVVFSKRTGEIKSQTEAPDGDVSMALPKEVMTRQDKARQAVGHGFETGMYGQIKGDTAAQRAQAQEYASSILAANHRSADTYGGLSADRAALIGVKIAKGELPIMVFADGPYKGEKHVIFEGRKYLIDPYAWQKTIPGRGQRQDAQQTTPGGSPAPQQTKAPPGAKGAGPTRSNVAAPFPLTGAPALTPVQLTPTRVMGPIRQPQP